MPECNECQHLARSSIEYPCNLCNTGEYWMPKLPPKPKGIDIIMTCGEVHHIDTVQPTIQEVKINGVVYGGLTAENYTNEKLAKIISKLTGCKWEVDGHGNWGGFEDNTRSLKKNFDISKHFSIPYHNEYSSVSSPIYTRFVKVK